MSPFYPPPGSPSRFLGSADGPASYPAGGFEIDLTTVFSNIEFFEAVVEVLGALPPVRFEIMRNNPTPGKVKLKLHRVRYDRATTPTSPNNKTGRVQNPPSGVGIRNASGSNAQAVDAIGGAGNAHAVDQLYDHDHPLPSLTQTQTDAAGVEIAAGTNLSGTRFRYNAIGT